MTNLVNLDRVAHQKLRINEELAFSACKDTTMCAISPTEIPRLMLEYPVAFTQHTDTKRFLLVALFGVDPERNLFWREGRWQSVAMPLNIGRQPFSVGVALNAAGGENTEKLVTCIDMDNPGVQETDGELLFDAEGNDTPYLKHKLSMLAELVNGEQRAQVFTTRVEELGLIRPAHLELKPRGGATRQIGGLFSIDESALRSLPAETLVELNGKGYLHILYAMLLSLGQFSMLASRNSSN
jgi:hypothetical protein